MTKTLAEKKEETTRKRSWENLEEWLSAQKLQGGEIYATLFIRYGRVTKIEIRPTENSVLRFWDE